MNYRYFESVSDHLRHRQCVDAAGQPVVALLPMQSRTYAAPVSGTRAAPARSDWSREGVEARRLDREEARLRERLTRESIERLRERNRNQARRVRIKHASPPLGWVEVRSPLR